MTNIQGTETGISLALADSPKVPGKLERMETMLLASSGASMAELVAATGWQQHSVRGAIAGALKKRGLIIASQKVDGVRRYQANKAA